MPQKTGVNKMAEDKKYDLTAIMAEYGEDDFGFTATDEEEYKTRLAEVEKIVVPFLMKLIKTADQPIIKWPNRRPILEAQVQKILNLTRN